MAGGVPQNSTEAAVIHRPNANMGHAGGAALRAHLENREEKSWAGAAKLPELPAGEAPKKDAPRESMDEWLRRQGRG